jgi:hypothetical protein
MCSFHTGRHRGIESMDNKTKGAWLVHHAQKLQHVSNTLGEFENINVAGKMGLLLSSLAC